MPHAAASAPRRLATEFAPLWISIDPTTGLPTAIGSSTLGKEIAVRASAHFLLGGHGRRGSHGDLVYDGAVPAADIAATGPVTDHLVSGGRCFSVPVVLGGWQGEIRYVFTARTPALTWSWHWRPGDGAEAIRDFGIDLDLQLPDRAGWTLDAPGSRLRPGLDLADLPPEVRIPSIGSTAAASGIVALSRNADETLLLWPRSKDEPAESLLKATADGIRLEHTTLLAAAAVAGADIVQDGIAIDLLPGGWPAIRPLAAGWLADLGISVPKDRPAWTLGATLYEAQIGTSIFAGGSWTYSPYPEMADLYNDLPRIAAMGFDTIQLMPRQPFPSYNVIDYDDVSTTFGDEGDLKRVVAWCHAHGMKLILDVLLHGVIDQESIDEVAASVRAGPWAKLISASVAEVAALRLTAREQERLSWSRHIIDFERAWHDGSPKRHPLADEHPEWFCRDDDDRIIGVYTKAFDFSNPEWHRYFSEKMLALVDRLGVDGFRFDAPSYNRFPNWAPRSRSRASLQELGTLSMFKSLREQMHRRSPELMLYTEPNGSLWRQSMDITYNYDETWLPDSILGRGGDHSGSRVRHGRDLARWLADRDATLPEGAVTAHHIDSHDTFWWPLPAVKWRREQFGIDGSRALMTAFALAGGPYMMFVGGEEGMEDAVGQVNAIRRRRPELAAGRHVYGAPEGTPDSLFVVRHEADEAVSVLIVNLSAEPASLRFTPPVAGRNWRDLLAGGEPAVESGQALAFPAFAARFLVAE